MKKRNIQFLIIFLFSVITGNVFAQQEVTGVVSDNIGELLPGATVMVLGTDDGTVTDFDGNFIITVPDNNSVLVVSFIGMKTIEITVGDQTTIDVILEADSQVMDEVIVTALGISRETKALGYSVSQVDGDELVAVPQENVLNALSGKVSGVAINSIGAPGSSVSMVIRGATSLSSDNQPLFVIDGVPLYNTLNNVGGVGSDNRVDYGSAISDLNPDDIESMTVLKGASAAALYGSRAGNGVVLITTKSGKSTKGMGVTINSSTVFDVPYKYLDTHSQYAVSTRPYTNDNFPANEYGHLRINEGSSAWAGPALDQGITAIQWPYTAEEIESGIPIPRELTSAGKDNASNFFQTAITSTNNISIQENTEKLDYRLSYTNMRNQGFIPNTDLNRNSVGLNSTYKLVTDDPSRKFLNGLSVSSSLNYTKSSSGNRPANNRGANPIQALYEIGPHIDIRDMKDYWLPGYEGLVQNSPYTFGQDPTDTEWNNPYFLANEVNNGFERNRFYGNARADWQITDEWSLFVRYMFDNVNETRETKMSSGYTREPNGAYGITNIGREETNTDFLLTWKKDYEDWNFSVSGGGNIRKNKSSNVVNQTKNRGQGLIIPNLFTLQNIAPENLIFASYKSEKHVNSLYGMASVGYKDIAYIDITGRNDWSSTLPEGNNSYFYPSISGSLLFNNIFDLGENVSLLKLRAGWAQVGNDTDPYRLDPVLGNAGAWGDATQLSMPSSILNPDLLPELQTSWEIGTDMAFFHNRLRFDFTYYEAMNENQIFQVDLPTSSGFSRKWINAGELNSSGIEGGLSGTIITNSDWNWDMGFVFSRNRTTLVELAPGLDFLKLWGDAKGGAYTWVGEEIGNIIDRALVRVDDPDSPYHGWPLLDDEGWENDDRTLQDADGNRVAPVIGNFNPDFIIGMTTSVSYKNWSLGMNFDWRSGGQFVSQTHRYGESDMHTERWLDKLHDLSDVGDIPTYLKDNQDQFLSPDGEFYVLVGGPTAEQGGFPVEDGGITLNDGVFMPGVYGEYDANGNFVAIQENLGGPGTTYHPYYDNYGWSFTKTATFDADFIKLREISIAYNITKKALGNTGLQNVTLSLFSRNIILWTAAGIGIDPENAFQAESGTQTSGIQFKQGIERFNVNPWAVPIGFKVNLTF